MLPFGGLSHLQPVRFREQRPDPDPPRSADSSPSLLRPSHAISDQTARTQASGVRDAALSIGVPFSGVSMDHSEDNSQLADVGISQYFFLFSSLLGLLLHLALLLLFPFLGSTWRLTFLCLS